jgi:hypothetical protein
MTDTDLSDARLATDRNTAAFYCVDNAATVFVKEGNFFRAQGGLIEDWGNRWVGIEAKTLGQARRYAAAHVFNKELSFIYKGEE